MSLPSFVAGQALNNPSGVALGGGVSGNLGSSLSVGGEVGLGAKVWENGPHSIGVGASYGQMFGRSQGHTFTSKPNIGVGLGYKFKF